MSRKYEKVQALLPEVRRLTEEGYTHRQVAEKLGLGSRKVVEQLLHRERQKAVQGVPKQCVRTGLFPAMAFSMVLNGNMAFFQQLTP